MQLKTLQPFISLCATKDVVITESTPSPMPSTESIDLGKEMTPTTFEYRDPLLSELDEVIERLR